MIELKEIKDIVSDEIQRQIADGTFVKIMIKE